MGGQASEVGEAVIQRDSGKELRTGRESWSSGPEHLAHQDLDLNTQSEWQGSAPEGRYGPHLTPLFADEETNHHQHYPSLVAAGG